MQWCCLMPTRKPRLRPSLEQPLVLLASGEPSTGLTLSPAVTVEGNCRLCCKTLGGSMPRCAHGIWLRLLCPT